MPERTVERFIAGNDRIGDTAEEAARLAHVDQLFPGEKAEVRQDRVHADRAVTLADDAAVAEIPQRLFRLELQGAAIVERHKYIDARKRRSNAGFRRT